VIVLPSGDEPYACVLQMIWVVIVRIFETFTNKKKYITWKQHGTHKIYREMFDMLTLQASAQHFKLYPRTSQLWPIDVGCGPWNSLWVTCPHWYRPRGVRSGDLRGQGMAPARPVTNTIGPRQWSAHHVRLMCYNQCWQWKLSEFPCCSEVVSCLHL
jgi:hypothetical protein